MIKKLYNFSKNKRKTERKLKKYYPTIVSVDLLFKEDDFSKSKIFEWIVINQLKTEYFWRDQYKNEVDAIMVDKEIVPIEIKYGKLDFKGLLAFMRKFNIAEGHIISSYEERIQKFDKNKILITPAFKFLLK